MRREEQREFHSDRRARVEGSEEEEDRVGRSMRVEGESWWARVTSMISEGVQATK
jgi:hypothetical protein